MSADARSKPLLATAVNAATAVAALALGATLAAGPVRAGEAIVAGGCFWCVEADFEGVAGVGDVVSGYTGGTTANPTYKDVTRGGTGHYEAVRIPFDDARISYAQILDLFFRSVDPTDAGGQFCDRGESYRTAVFVASDAERQAAEAAKARAEQALGREIVTPILPAATFTVAEDYHQDYYKRSEVVLTRRGPKSKAEAYKFYRNGCGRDDRIVQIWGSDAPFVK